MPHTLKRPLTLSESAEILYLTRKIYLMCLIATDEEFYQWNPKLAVYYFMNVTDALYKIWTIAGDPQKEADIQHAA